MKCPRCGAEAPAGAKRCGSCGAHFVAGQYCPHCGKVIPKGSARCPKCGRTIAQAAGKKPLTGRWWFWAVCILLVLGIISNLGNAINRHKGGLEKASPSPAAAAASPSPAPTAEPTASPTPPPASTAEPESAGTPKPQGNGNVTNRNDGGSSSLNTYDDPGQQQTSASFVLNNNTMKFHYPDCTDVKKIAPNNYAAFNGTSEEAKSRGYSSCGHCRP